MTDPDHLAKAEALADEYFDPKDPANRYHAVLVKDIVSLLAREREAVREECAKIADKYVGDPWLSDIDEATGLRAQVIAAAIRSLKAS